MVLLRPKESATAPDIAAWQKNCKGLPGLWWVQVLVPAVKCLPPTSRTRRHNAVNTIEDTHILPPYLRLYEEDLAALEEHLQVGDVEDFTWFFYSCKFGQRKLAKREEQLGAGAFGLDDCFDLSKALRVSLHLGFNFESRDNSSLFWNFDRTKTWMRGESPLTKQYYKSFHVDACMHACISCSCSCTLFIPQRHKAIPFSGCHSWETSPRLPRRSLS